MVGYMISEGSYIFYEAIELSQHSYDEGSIENGVFYVAYILTFIDILILG